MAKAKASGFAVSHFDLAVRNDVMRRFLQRYMIIARWSPTPLSGVLGASLTAAFQLGS
jgi:hypothetical protein